MFRRNREKPVHRSKWRRLRRWSLIALVVLAIGAFASVEITSRSSFCNSCHIMGPYYTSWTSDPHSHVECVNCHIPPGATNYVSAKLNGLGQVADDWLNRTSTKPSASVSDFACTREGCHLVSELDTSDSAQRGYFFDHRRHEGLEYRGIAVKCTTCHSHFKDGEMHFDVNTNACIACHLMPTSSSTGPGVGAMTAATPGSATANAHTRDPLVAPAGCASCHQAPQEPFEYQGLMIDHTEYLAHGASCESCHRGVTSTPPPVGDSQCLNCHVFGRERVTDADDMHRVHTEGRHKVECFNCHGVLEHGPSAQILSLNQFDCRSCHTDQHQIQRSAYLNGEGHGLATRDQGDGDLLISPMFLAHVDCTGCHVQPTGLKARPGSGALVARAVPQACDACHQEGFGAQMIPMWQRATREMYDSVSALLPASDDRWAEGDDTTERLVREARELIDLVRLDGSWGVHNPRYTQTLLENAREKLVTARSAAEAREGGSP